ncbi:MAG TPA: hypothetical protein H9966_00465 [Candidatus Prevotella avicola]|uniref:Uncharacterized protein n=1 Tax=Candidatus Prevotella avicola TaxID=2838738 RepID=A0A9D2FX03_9BACT|nr:hypothetical protein [Candidatus Prevotella avicola]
MVVMVLMGVPMSVVMISHNARLLFISAAKLHRFPRNLVAKWGRAIMESHSERIGLQETRHYRHHISAT